MSTTEHYTVPKRQPLAAANGHGHSAVPSQPMRRIRAGTTCDGRVPLDLLPRIDQQRLAAHREQAYAEGKRIGIDRERAACSRIVSTAWWLGVTFGAACAAVLVWAVRNGAVT